jgi:hypothetical protein
MQHTNTSNGSIINYLAAEPNVHTIIKTNTVCSKLKNRLPSMDMMLKIITRWCQIWEVNIGWIAQHQVSNT